MIENTVGLEFEYMLKDVDTGELVLPADFGFTTDEFPVLGEVRVRQQHDVDDLYLEFVKELHKLKLKVKKNHLANLELCLGGIVGVNNKRYAEFLTAMGSKFISDTHNVYGTDILELTNDIIHNGKVVGKVITAGLHIHFGSIITESTRVDDEYKYIPVKIPVVDPLQDNNITFTNLYKRELKSDYEVKKVEALVSRITNPVINEFVKALDVDVLPKYLDDVVEYGYSDEILDIKLSDAKYRNPGFYETKSWGFEYRSLPFNQSVIDDMYNIIEKSFELLNSL